jgi:cathepsin D
MSTGKCVSAFFRLSTDSSAPKFIIGDTFLKLVYSVFQYEPPMVGFANLSAVALGLSNIGQPLPTPSLGASVVISSSMSNYRDLSLVTLMSLLLFVSFALTV